MTETDLEEHVAAAGRDKLVKEVRLKATVTAFPHFDPAKDRVKGNYS